jgi:hypothetical protein
MFLQPGAGFSTEIGKFGGLGHLILPCERRMSFLKNERGLRNCAGGASGMTVPVGSAMMLN